MSPSQCQGYRAGIGGALTLLEVSVRMTKVRSRALRSTLGIAIEHLLSRQLYSVEPGSIDAKHFHVISLIQIL